MNFLLKPKQKIWQIESAALTDRGTKRDLNQDYIFHQTGRTDKGETVGLFIVCDGMGGHQAGEVASRLAVETITAELGEIFSQSTSFKNGNASPSAGTVNEKIEVAIGQANAEIRSFAHNHPQQASNLGTTVTLALVYDKLAHIANIGDGRAYAWRAGEVTRITHDHSLAAEMARQGLIDEVQVAHHARSNVLTRALGSKEQIEVDVFDWVLEPGDKLLLCSDGFWKAFADNSELAGLLGSKQAPADLCQQLLTLAKERDGSDNISVVIMSFNEAEC